MTIEPIINHFTSFPLAHSIFNLKLYLFNISLPILIGLATICLRISIIRKLNRYYGYLAWKQSWIQQFDRSSDFHRILYHSVGLMRRKLESKALRGCVVTLQFDLFQLTEKCIEANITSTGGNIAALSGALSGAVYGGCVTAGHLAQRSLSRNDAAIL